MYFVVISLIEIALNNWASYDAWCLSRGFDPLDMPSRRFVNSIWAWLTDGMDFEAKDKLLDLLHQTSYEQQARPQRKLKAETDNDGPESTIVPNSKWRAPEGWTPPGWDEEASYNNAMSFIDSKNSGFSR